jgi:hypothetical protein
MNGAGKAKISRYIETALTYLTAVCLKQDSGIR